MEKVNVSREQQVKEIVKVVAKGVNKKEPVVVSSNDFKFENLVKIPFLTFENGEQIPFILNQTSIYDIIDFAKEHKQLKSKFKIIVENMYCRKNEIKSLFSTSYVIDFKFENELLTIETIGFVKPITLYINYKYHNYKELDDIIENFLVERSKYNKDICDNYNENAIETIFYMLF